MTAINKRGGGFKVVIISFLFIGIVCGFFIHNVIYPSYKIEVKTVTLQGNGPAWGYDVDYYIGFDNFIRDSEGNFYKLSWSDDLSQIRNGDTLKLCLKVYDPPEGYKWDYYQDHEDKDGHHVQTNKKVVSWSRIGSPYPYVME